MKSSFLGFNADAFSPPGAGEPAFIEIVGLALKLAAGTAGALCVFENGVADVLAAMNMTPETPLASVLCARLAETRRTLVLGDAEKDSTLQPHLLPYKKLAAFPLIAANGIFFGALVVVASEGGEFTFDQLEALGALARQTVRLLEWRGEAERAHAALLEHGRLAVLGASASAIAHEVKNPLATATLMVQMLRESPGLDPAKRENMTRKVDVALARIGQTVSSMQRLGRRRDTGVSEKTMASDLAHDILEIARVRAKEADIELRVSVPEVDLECRVALLGQLLWSLLTNALEAVAGTPSAWIEFGCADLGEAIRWDVRDSGPGIAEENRARVMDPYFTTKVKHAGLGLAQARDLARTLGGQLELMDEEPSNHFRLRLPKVAPNKVGTR